MSKAKLIESGEGAFALQGNLTFETVRGVLEAICQRLGESQKRELTLDLSAVKEADSAGLVLLLEVVEIAESVGGQICFQSPPEGLLSLARISNVEGLLPLG